MIKYLVGLMLSISMLQAATLSSKQANYQAGQSLTFTFSQMPQDRDWIAIYPANANNDWANVLAWKWTGDVAQGTLTFNALAAGNYEARIFFHNSFNDEARAPFTISANQNNTSITTSKATYNAGEHVRVTVSGMSGNDKDWVAIYPVESNNSWDNVVAWKYTNGTISLGDLPAGNYEARAFFNNSFHLEASSNFTVVAINLPPTVYETAENGLSGDWKVTGGGHGIIRVPVGFNSNGAVQLKTHWVDNTRNIAEYQLNLHQNKNQHILEVDVGGVGNVGERPAGIHSGWARGLMPHYKIGVIATTTQGYRLITWSSFYTHSNIPATRRDYGSWVALSYPDPQEQVRWNSNKNLWERHTFDIQAYIDILEPGNKLISVDKFIATGGNLDNITLR